MRAMIFGVTGQDGSYLSELLIDKGYHVVGVRRRTSTPNLCNIEHLVGHEQFELVEGDVTDFSSVIELVSGYDVDEIYNLAAQSVTEETLLPIKTGNSIRYRDFKSIWDEQIRKGRPIRIENDNIEVIDINHSQNGLMALGYSNSAGNWYCIKQISRHKWTGKVAKLSQKFGSVTVTPNHSLIDIHNNIVTPASNPWMLNIRKINTVIKKPLANISFVLRGYSATDGYVGSDDNGVKGLVKSKCDNIAHVCNFIGAFVSEGHTSYNTANDTYTVNISQQDISWLQDKEKSLDSFFSGNKCYVTHKKSGYKDVNRLEIKSKYLYTLLRKWCGTESSTKCLPDWFTKLDKTQAKVLFDSLISGDGCWTKEGGWRYTTISYKLACQLSWLFTYLGYEYTVNEEKDGIWHFRSCTFYSLNQGEDGKKITWLDYDGYVYDISVDEVTNFAVGVGNIVVHNSHVGTSFKQPTLTWNVTALGCMNILECIRLLGFHSRFYQASSSEMFGDSYSVTTRKFGDASYEETKYQDENTPFSPQSPYAIAKLAAHNTVKLYRKAYGIHASCGILLNHESKRRGELFVTRKITKYVAGLIVNGFKDKLKLGNLEAKRDWGHAQDYVRAMYLMLQQDDPGDYVIATGRTHSIKDFLHTAFSFAQLDWQDYVEIDPEFIRPSEVPHLLGDASLAREKLGWEPKITFEQLVEEMVRSDEAKLRR